MPNARPAGDANLWQKAALVVPETAEAAAAIPAKLEALRDLGAGEMQATGLQLWRRYGLPDFVADLRNARSRRRAAGGSVWPVLVSPP